MIETIDLVKEFKGYKAVNNACVKIDNGKIYGLIGKNGAGKTTFIRMIAGLIFPSSGKIIINGKNDQAGLSQQRNNMSFIVETPYYEPSLTAYENMELQRISRGISKNSDPSLKWLKFAGLDDTGKKKCGNFSLGMRQRLGIAMAMLAEPEVLFLDEPINGLDPLGIVQMRDLIKDMNKEYKTTIVISSHILSELYHVATDYIFIDNGRIIDQFTREHLDEKCKTYIEICIDDTDKSAELLKSKLGCKELMIKQNESTIRIYDENIDISVIAPLLVKNDILVYKLNKTSVSLEEFFISKVNEQAGHSK